MGERPPIKIGIAGALGRMGLAVAKAVEARDDFLLTARFDRPGVEGEGLTSPELAIDTCDVIVDFTTSAASASLAARAAAVRRPALVIGTTGLTSEGEAAMRAAAMAIPIVKSGNFSLGLNVLAGLVEQAARRLGAADWDIEVFEAHHRRKVDAPSGTALMLSEAAARGRGVNRPEVEVRARDGITGPRAEGTIGFSVMRGGGIIGEHSVTFAAEEETLTLSHSALNRDLFARGAVTAAAWVAARPPGLYDMMDVLGFRSA